MATRKGYYSPRPSYRFLTGERDSLYSIGTNINDPLSELDEFEIWNSVPDPMLRRNGPGSRTTVKKSASMTRVVEEGGGFSGGSSVPVNVPDWSKILRKRGPTKESFGDGGDVTEEDDDDDEYRVPPHEVVERRTRRRRRVASYSVHEGIGRTLKGRDLSRVRDAIWEKTGFMD